MPYSRETPKIFILDDEPDICDMVKQGLIRQGFAVCIAHNVTQATQVIVSELPNLLLLDWMLPKMSGIDYLSQLRQNSESTNLPVIMLTAKATEEDKVRGLDAGADDYISKPFSIRELVARIRAVLRRHERTADHQIFEHGPLYMDTTTWHVSANGVDIRLRSLEFRLLEKLLASPGRVFSRDTLLDNIWGENTEVSDRAVDVTIRRLRKALEAGGCAGWVETIHGSGYRLAIRKVY